MTETTNLDRRALLAGPLGLAAMAAAAKADAAAPPALPTPEPEPWVKPMIRGYAPGPYGQIHYRETGGVGPAVVFFHQSPMTSQQFNAVYPIFAAAGFRAIGVDTPGFGGSDVTQFVPTVEAWAKIYPALLDHLNIRKADIVGHHTGACTAAEVCLQYPERVGKFAFHGAIIISPEERRKFLEGTLNGERKGPAWAMDGSHLSNYFLSVKSRYEKGGPATPQLLTKFVIENFSHTGAPWYGHYAAFMYDHEAALKKVKHPMLLVNNTGDQIYVESQRLLKVRPDIQYAELKGGAIDVVDQLPQQWADVIIKFLKA